MAANRLANSLLRDRPDGVFIRILAWPELPRAILAVIRLPFYLPRLAADPGGKGRPIFVIPGFAMSDTSTAILRAYLTWLDYRHHNRSVATPSCNPRFSAWLRA